MFHFQLDLDYGLVYLFVCSTILFNDGYFFRNHLISSIDFHQIKTAVQIFKIQNDFAGMVVASGNQAFAIQIK